MRPTTEGKTQLEHHGTHQPSLPFAAAEGSCAERRLMLGNALVLAECDCELARLCELVFTHTGDGLGQPWPATIARLQARPWALCCGRSKARETLERAERLGLVRVERTKTAAGADAGFKLAIDWRGVRQRLGVGIEIQEPEIDDPGGGCETRTLGCAVQTLGVERRTLPTSALLNSKSFFNSSEIQIQTRTGPDPEPELLIGKKEQTASAEPGPERVSILARVPELVAAWPREVAPLPAGDLLHGVFRPLAEASLKRPFGLVEWFRRQLSALAPVTGDSEAELLLVLAAAVYALRLKTVRLNRAAAFVACVSRGEWRRVVPYIPDARRQLDELLARQPDLLTRGAVTPSEQTT